MLIGVVRRASRGCDADARRRGRGRRVGLAFALACLTRYEAWPVTAAALVAAALGALARAATIRGRCARASPRSRVYPAAAVARASRSSAASSIGEWFVAERLLRAGEQGARRSADRRAPRSAGARATLSGPALIVARRRRRSRSLLVVGLVEPPARATLLAAAGAASATAALPWLAFLDGHPFRIRYMVPLIAAEAVGAGVVAGIVPRRRLRARCASRCSSLAALRAAAARRRRRRWSSKRSGTGRTRRCAQRVTDCLGAAVIAARRSWPAWDRSATTCRSCRAPASRSAISCTKATATSGWRRSIGPRPYAGWMLIEEKAEGGDMLAHARARATRVSRRVRARLRRRRGRALSTDSEPDSQAGQGPSSDADDRSNATRAAVRTGRES